ncbi:hypothetical protein DFJ58DRAFT_737822 [Suillus subalutaceus]|uniref:uncharacterized protein n=1 Tax=Suillus subalutaceus TaxID=48586 RepID=UPI001B8812F3|nr:uncharacterized protein DFJ58DRAFT_737822 [Suillus subalutaceus]KAG1828314.1 hypothetical protein DFJ58DRAFT_737822 [Suillus subalutaceus]
MSTPFTFSFTSHIDPEAESLQRDFAALRLRLDGESACVPNDKGEKCTGVYSLYAEQLRAVKEEATKQAEVAAAKQVKGKGKGKAAEPEDDPMGEKDTKGEDEEQVGKEKEVLVMRPKARMSVASKVIRNIPKSEWCEHVQSACLGKPDHACDPCRKSKVKCSFSTGRTGPVKNAKPMQKVSSAAESAPAGRAAKPIADLIRRTASDQVQVEAMDVSDAEDEVPTPRKLIRAQLVPVAQGRKKFAKASEEVNQSDGESSSSAEDEVNVQMRIELSRLESQFTQVQGLMIELAQGMNFIRTCMERKRKMRK